jgi:hypothetical protein
MNYSLIFREVLMNESNIFAVKGFAIWAMLSLPGNLATLYFCYVHEENTATSTKLTNGNIFTIFNQ